MNYAEQLGITRHVTFAGAVDQDHILDFYQAADIFVLPSFAEGLPVVLMEAMSMEIPCVTTAITGIPELIQNGENGLLTAASDTDGLADAVNRLIADPQMRRKLGEAGRRKVLSDYDLYKNSRHLYMTLSRRLSEIA